MSASIGGASFDWPLSRDEKKHQIMQLYDKELQAAGSLLQSTEAALEGARRDSMTLKRTDSTGLRHGRVSDVSTADSEYSACGYPMDHLGAIHEDGADPIHFAPRDDDDFCTDAQLVAERLRQAVAEAAATLQVLTSRPSSLRRPSNPPSAAEPGLRRCYSENSQEFPRCVSARRPSAGTRVLIDASHRGSRGNRSSRSRQTSVASDCVDSDGDQGDTEDHQAEVPGRRRRRSGAGATPPARQKASQRVKSCNMDRVDECESPMEKNDFYRSRSVPPTTSPAAVRTMPMLSLDAFLGQSVPFNPF